MYEHRIHYNKLLAAVLLNHTNSFYTMNNHNTRVDIGEILK